MAVPVTNGVTTPPPADVLPRPSDPEKAVDGQSSEALTAAAGLTFDLSDNDEDEVPSITPHQPPVPIASLDVDSNEVSLTQAPPNDSSTTAPSAVTYNPPPCDHGECDKVAYCSRTGRCTHHHCPPHKCGQPTLLARMDPGIRPEPCGHVQKCDQRYKCRGGRPRGSRVSKKDEEFFDQVERRLEMEKQQRASTRSIGGSSMPVESIRPSRDLKGKGSSNPQRSQSVVPGSPEIGLSDDDDDDDEPLVRRASREDSANGIRCHSQRVVETNTTSRHRKAPSEINADYDSNPFAINDYSRDSDAPLAESSKTAAARATLDGVGSSGGTTRVQERLVSSAGPISASELPSRMLSTLKSLDNAHRLMIQDEASQMVKHFEAFPPEVTFKPFTRTKRGADSLDTSIEELEVETRRVLVLYHKFHESMELDDGYIPKRAKRWFDIE